MKSQTHWLASSYLTRRYRILSYYPTLM